MRRTWPVDMILFGDREDDPRWRPFSNFSRHGFSVDGIYYPTSEHFFQAAKALTSWDAARIYTAATPGEAKRLGREVLLRPDWDEVKFQVMLVALLAKFSQNPALKELLLSTGDRELHENRPDPVWGGGPRYPNGQDLLGQALMRVREVLHAG